MRNVADTHAYSLFDHVFSQTVRTLSKVVGLRRVTQPFWARWLASGVREDIIFRFLDEVGDIDAWATTAADVLRAEIDRFEARRGALTAQEQVVELRNLSYLAHMGQWGTLPLDERRRALYRLARDYYVEAETLAFGDLYARLPVAWRGGTLYANLHARPAPAPMIVVVHGIDGCKEEHLATELTLHAQGYSVMTVDGPGQGESQVLSGILWDADFPQAISAAIDAGVARGAARADAIGLLGISIGGMWALRCAADDARVRAVFDLGAPLHTRRFPGLPFLIKTRLCQVTGARDAASIQTVLAQNNIESEDLLGRIACDVRMVHGGRDRVVSVADKQWLLERLQAGAARRGGTRDLSLRVIETGDHCCTGHADAVREDAVAFFKRALPPRP